MPILFGIEDPAVWRAALNSYEDELKRASTGKVRAHRQRARARVAARSDEP